MIIVILCSLYVYRLSITSELYSNTLRSVRKLTLPWLMMAMFTIAYFFIFLNQVYAKSMLYYGPATLYDMLLCMLKFNIQAILSY